MVKAKDGETVFSVGAGIAWYFSFHYAGGSQSWADLLGLFVDVVIADASDSIVPVRAEGWKAF
jgi:hypothetical protein